MVCIKWLLMVVIYICLLMVLYRLLMLLYLYVVLYRLLMLLLDKPTIRDVIAFPLNQSGEDLLMGAPSEVTDDRLQELAIAVKRKPKTEG